MVRVTASTGVPFNLLGLSMHLSQTKRMRGCTGPVSCLPLGSKEVEKHLAFKGRGRARVGSIPLHSPSQLSRKASFINSFMLIRIPYDD